MTLKYDNYDGKQSDHDGECEACEAPPSPPALVIQSELPIRRNLRPLWQTLYEHVNSLLEKADARNAKMQLELNLACQEIARLREFNSDVNLGLEEIARQRQFMTTMGRILSRGRLEPEDVSSE
ncbi:hypothetical protein BDZ97DRAFT_1762155 [Flammula alnicola]|nr:hypothetical protein BDZ97DRAFT_1762155 [Flammula alnicola]